MVEVWAPGELEWIKGKFKLKRAYPPSAVQGSELPDKDARNHAEEEKMEAGENTKL